jgi:glycosyltransferase involved in cell wall biosynthesis
MNRHLERGQMPIVQTRQDPLGESETRPELSIVIPAFNEKENIHIIYRELTKVLGALEMSWEILFVDDGSKDGTWEQIVSLNKLDPNVKGLRLTRNFGHQYALLAGLGRSIGRAVISMDGDLQHPPEDIPRLVEEWKKGSKVVNTIRRDPSDFSIFKKLTAVVYYKVFSFLSGVKIERGMADFRLLDRQAVDSVLQFPEEGLFLRGLVQWIGYESSSIEYQSNNRFSGTSKFTLRKMARFAWNGITSFSLIPLRLAIFIGIATSVAAFGFLAHVVYTKWVLPENLVPGWATTVGIVSLLFGILFILLGIMGEYLGRILVETRGRPRFLIGEKVGVKEL